MSGGESPCRSGFRLWSLANNCYFLSSSSLRHFRFWDRQFDLSDELDVNTVCYHANGTFGRCHQLPTVGCLVSTVTNCRNSGGFCVPPSFNLFKLRYLLYSGFILATVSTGMAELASSWHFSSFWNRSAFVFAPFLHLMPAKPKALAPAGLCSQEHHQRLCWQSSGEVWLFHLI